MGRYLAAGVAVQIKVKERTGWYRKTDRKLKDCKDDIVKQFGRFIDLSHFEVKMNNDCILFNIDDNYFNRNIHEAFLKFNKVLDLKFDMFRLDEDFEESNDILGITKDIDVGCEKRKIFNEENWPIKLTCEDDKYQIQTWDGGCFIDTQPFSSNVWLFYGDNKDLFSVCDVCINYACIYMGMSKINMEDDSGLLTALNVLANNIFKEGLTSDISFYISG